ncbi:hypothetical protein [Rhodoligotrophos ferricapiens]|uniref:hypothetical protein n=1 Tax=Rhodoligotrophos ferricapiens TaxID=3069264 RepID=UPI00315D77C7
MTRKLLLVIAIGLWTSLTSASAQSVPPAAASWLRCAALGALAGKGAPDKVSKEASTKLEANYKELFTAYLVALEGKGADPRVVRTRVAGLIHAMIEKRRMLNREEQPALLACLRDMDRLTADIPETVRKMVTATPRPTESTMRRDMWATCSVALAWAVESGLTGDPEVRNAARRYRQLFQIDARRQGLSDAEIDKGLNELKAVASKKSVNELKSAIASCVREKP